jgi:hypothetical protein
MTVHPHHQLQEITRVTRSILDQWDAFETTAAAITHSDSDRLGVHGGDICDPVYASSLANQTWNETAAEISEALGLLRSIERRVTGVAAQHPETARAVDAAKRAARCADPVCTDNAVKDGYCFPHWQHQRAS